ncbi:MAG: GPW/gp25 family protein [Cyanobacteria bacterium SBLK]|nr:GPW/gp25 family protein [Cyanobacteria bacterium SBLK]
MLTPNTPYWQTDQKKHGQILTDRNDINRCIENILLTPLGAVPHHPDFGANLNAFLDRPIDSVRGLLVREIYRAIEQWEPRVKIENVNINYNAMKNIVRLNVDVFWILVGSQATGTINVLVL